MRPGESIIHYSERADEFMPNRSITACTGLSTDEGFWSPARADAPPMWPMMQLPLLCLHPQLGTTVDRS